MNMQPLLIELGTDELPVKALPGLAQAFFDGVIAGLQKRGVDIDMGEAKPLYTPRRLTVLLPGVANGRALRHVLDVRDPTFVDADFIALARKHGFATVFTDSPDHPSFADVTADFVYARLMRSRSEIATGYPADELKAWATRAREWARGDEPGHLPKIVDAAPPSKPRDVFIQFISAAKERNPAAAMALQAILARG